MATSISTMGQQMGVISRIKQMQENMSNYQQQISTGVKYQDFKGYGIDSLRIQRYRADLASITSYTYNIDTAQSSIQQMTSAVSESMEQAGNVLDAISVQMEKGSEFDLEAVKNAAATALQIIESNMNTRVGDRYLFSGSDVGNKPYSGSASATSNIQARISDWLDGTTTTQDMIDGINGMTDSQSGYSTTLQSAKSIYARADDAFEVDYTVLANSDGFKNVVNALRALSNLEIPTEGADVPPSDDFYTVLNAMYQKLQTGVDGMRADSGKLASSAQVLESIKQNHLTDRQNLQRTLENTEAADTTDAVIRFQTLQTQLAASYQVTAILSQLSLARVLGG